MAHSLYNKMKYSYTNNFILSLLRVAQIPSHFNFTLSPVPIKLQAEYFSLGPFHKSALLSPRT